MYSPHLYGSPTHAYVHCHPIYPQLPNSSVPNQSTPSHNPHFQENVVCLSHVVKIEVGWFPDSRATNHLTNATHALHLTTSYTVPCKVLAGNGFYLHIFAIGSYVVQF